VKQSAANRGYDGAWRKVRLVVLERDGHRCAWCARPATTVDHVRPLAEGGARLDPGNLVACCVRCNSVRGQQVSTRRRAASSLAPGSGFIRADATASRRPFLGAGSTLDPAAVVCLSPGPAAAHPPVITP
jgi:hypothetical protein